MDIRKIRKLIEIVRETGVAEIEISEGEESVRIVSHYNDQQPVMAHYAHQPMTYASPPPLTSTAIAPAAVEPTVTAAPAGHAVKSPMVGTAYLSPAPNADVFVKVGQRVEVGDVLCIVEAMKMFNHIEADVAGTLQTCLIENGQPVEYDQPLFIIT